MSGNRPKRMPVDEFTILVIRGVEGLSVYINDLRIAGNKPWGGGEVVREWKNIKAEDVLYALGLQDRIATLEKRNESLLLARDTLEAENERLKAELSGARWAGDISEEGREGWKAKYDELVGAAKWLMECENCSTWLHKHRGGLTSPMAECFFLGIVCARKDLKTAIEGIGSE